MSGTQVYTCVRAFIVPVHFCFLSPGLQNMPDPRPTTHSQSGGGAEQEVAAPCHPWEPGYHDNDWYDWARPRPTFLHRGGPCGAEMSHTALCAGPKFSQLPYTHTQTHIHPHPHRGSEESLLHFLHGWGWLALSDSYVGVINGCSRPR